MALATNPIDTNRGTTSLALPAELSQEIWAGAVEESAVMQLAQRITLPGRGLSIPVVTGDAVADFVAESTEKAVSKPTLESKVMTPYKIAVIELFSDEFRRDIPALYDELVRRAPAAIGKKFDATVFGGTAPGTGFDTLTSAAAVALGTDAYAGMVGALSAIAVSGGRMNGIALSAQGEALLLVAVDSAKRPIFIDSANDDSAIGRVLGSRVVAAQQAYKAGGTGQPNVVGYAGDWNAARYGIVDGINIAFSNEATINDGTNLINLWQRNMFAVRIEAEVGFVTRDIAAFAKLTDATS